MRNVSPTEYGNRVGVFRLMEVLDRHRVRGTVALNASVCHLFPRIIEEALKRGWELMGHGVASGLLTNLTPEEEKEAIFR